jgi:two-component system, response regulator FlrC
MSLSMPNRRVLFVVRTGLVTEIFPVLKREGVEAGIAESLKGALSYVQRNQTAFIFSEPSLPGYRVEGLLQELSSLKDAPPLVVVAEHGSAQEAQRLMELGVRDYWLAPLTWEKIRAVLPQDDGKAQAMPAKGLPRERHLIAEHPLMKRTLALARKVAGSKATVLISGESGTGKEMIARYIHEQSPRSDNPFIAVNCAALPEHLLESELFGHEKGAFTGAISRKPGRFELATGGTLLLDEISELDIGLQAKLLRVLQEGEIDRVGGTETLPVDVRVLATTNRKIEECVEKGEFRQDLFYRLNVIPLRLPPLRDRGEDIMPLARHFVNRFCREYGLGLLEISPEARDWLLSYSWPGNVRELQNLMERAVLLSGQGPVQTSHFLVDSELWLEEFGPIVDTSAEGGGQNSAGESSGTLPSEKGDLVPLHVMEQRMIIRSLDHTEGNRTQAALLLGISVRTLRNKINEYKQQGLDVP